MILATKESAAEKRERILKRHPRVLRDASNVGVIGVAPFDVGVLGKDPRVVTIIATTEDVDLQHEVVVASGGEWSYFETNGNLFADHQTDFRSGAAVLRSNTAMMAVKNGVRRQVGWKVNACMRNNELGNDLLTMLAEGGVGASIGFVPIDGGSPTNEEAKLYGKSGEDVEYVHRDWKGLEVSFTLFPCNVPCRATLGDTKSVGTEDSLTAIEGLLRRDAIRKSSAAAVGFPVRTSPAVRVKWVRA